MGFDTLDGSVVQVVEVYIVLMRTAVSKLYTLAGREVRAPGL